MLKHIFLIKDTKAVIFHGPFTSINKSTFLRELEQLRNSDTQFGKHPQDFAVYTLGTIDDSTGKVDVNPPEHVMNLDQIFGALIND